MTVGELREAMAATVVPQDPAPSTATRGSRSCGILALLKRSDHRYSITMTSVISPMRQEMPQEGRAMTFSDTLEQIRSGPVGPEIGAFFDFDGTLIEGYSANALYSHRLRNHDLGIGEVVHTIKAMSGGTLAESEFMSLVNRGFTSWAGRPVEELEELGEELFKKQIAGSLWHETWRLVKAHQRQGHTVAI